MQAFDLGYLLRHSIAIKATWGCGIKTKPLRQIWRADLSKANS
jgi:hypothetical protein